jgi:tetratricopeptide (TPR) repeat protein
MPSPPDSKIVLFSRAYQPNFDSTTTLFEMKTILTFIMVCILSDQTTSIPARTSDYVPVTSLPGTDAQADYDRALLLLHNFEYPDARDLFREAQKKKPSFALAYWGEAMTFNHPVWQNQDPAGGREVIDRYKRTVTGKSQLPALDRDLLESIEILYGEGSKSERDKSYSDFMGRLYRNYEGNHDVAAFYALSLLGRTLGWNTELCNRAAEICKAILKENPKHPGALHYFIHAEDHPEYAKLAWEEANDYAKVASYSGHALHMPSHIYLALGLWDDVVKSNEISWQAGVDRKKDKALNNDALNYHGYWWLEYAYLQQGRFGKAREVLKNQETFTNELSSARARNHLVVMRGHYLIETNDWTNTLAGEEINLSGLRVEIKSLDRFLKGLKAFKNGDPTSLASTIAEIETYITQALKTNIAEDGITMCTQGTPQAGSLGQASVNQATILKEQLQALQAFLRKEMAVAKSHFQKAIALEEKNGYFYGPPEIMKPTYEFYGEFLLAVNEPEKALENFEKALQKAPGRTMSLRGLARAAKDAGDKSKEAEALKQLKDNLQQADHHQFINFFSYKP